MGKFNIHIMSHMSKAEFRILTAVEVGMKNHEMVPGPLIHQLANLRSGGVSRKLYELAQHRLVSFERGKHCDGYRLTNLGYDYLALKCLLSTNVVAAVGSQFGCGKESDIYLVQDSEENTRCMKIHRLGRTSFRNVKNKRDYHKKRHISSWLYLSRISADREFKFMEILYENGFPVPKPYGCNRHIVIMEEIMGVPLNHIKDMEDPGKLFAALIELIIKLANYGLIHCDFNEFNVMVIEDDKPVLIDFPQMVSISHPDAQEYFERDVDCIVSFFKRRFRFECEEDQLPHFVEDIHREHDLDTQVRASGYNVHELEVVSEDEESCTEEDIDEIDEKDNEIDEEYTVTHAAEGLPTSITECVSTVDSESASEDRDWSNGKKGISKKMEREMERVKMLRMRREKMRESGLMNDDESFRSESHYSYSGSGMCSILSTTSTRAEPKFVRGRVLLEAKDRAKTHIPKKALRAKGEANAYNRKRKENINTIKEEKEALFF